MVEMLRGLINTNVEDEQLLISLYRNLPHPDPSELFYPANGTVMRSPERIIDLALAYKPVEIVHPEFDRLVRFAKTVAEEQGKDWKFVLDPVGLIFPEVIRKGNYYCDPENSVEFASTGGDGLHYCFLVADGIVRADSPVLLCRPDGSEPPNVVVGENLHEFLCLGMNCAYFDLLRVLEYPDERVGDWFGDDVWEEQRELLIRMRREFNLEPWPARKSRLAELQEKYLTLFEPPLDY
jgi:hypothetical protein